MFYFLKPITQRYFSFRYFGMNIIDPLRKSCFACEIPAVVVIMHFCRLLNRGRVPFKEPTPFARFTAGASGQLCNQPFFIFICRHRNFYSSLFFFPLEVNKDFSVNSWPSRSSNLLLPGIIYEKRPS